MNQFEHLDAQNEMSRFAQMTGEELTELNNWIDEVNAKMDEQTSN